MIKQKNFILLAVLGLFLSSCSDSENDNVDKTDAIVGSWQYKPENVNVSVTTSDERFTSVLKDFFTENILEDYLFENYNFTTTFTENGIYSTVIQDGAELSVSQGTYITENGKLKMTLDGDEDEEITEFDIAINNNVMILSFDYLASLSEQEVPIVDMLIEGLFNNPQYYEQLKDIDKESIEITSIKVIQTLTKVL